jgi:hypothetical protein
MQLLYKIIFLIGILAISLKTLIFGIKIKIDTNNLIDLYLKVIILCISIIFFAFTGILLMCFIL